MRVRSWGLSKNGVQAGERTIGSGVNRKRGGGRFMCVLL